MGQEFYIKVFIALLAFFSIIAIVFVWKRFPSLRRIFLVTWGVLFSYPILERLLVFNGSNVAYLLTFLLHVGLGLCIYIILYMMAFATFNILLMLFWPKSEKEKRSKILEQKAFPLPILYFLAIFTTIISMVVAYSHPKTVHYKVEVGKNFQPFKIAIVADLHLRKYMSESITSKAIDLTQQLNPDLILLLGDNTDAPLAGIENLPAAQKLEKLEAPLGVYAIAGNNEGQWLFVEKQAKDYYASLGITYLEDELIILPNGVQIVGRGDKTTHPNRKSLEWLKKREKPADLTIYLDHQPVDFDKHQESGTQLILSGHTHGGQFFPLNYLFRMIYPTVGGVHQYGDMISVASRGLGFSRAPLRLGAFPELVILEVVPKE